MEERTFVVREGQKFMNVRKKTTYIVKSIEGNSAMLVSEDGKACMTIRSDELLASWLKPLYD
jgi:hypothetical protein